ncbi:MAG: hypothetical protein COV01_00040 [Candidatus Taylorbacteria bacterium CG10_big_fil_rev_8_21_14_0_10_41_48]|uniref:Nudix hydrolase domain-containing protein n=1 Tax=Candidatus Taylorbacteria bacterium CG10_big_fil_rev_8_21_14_0_10_41_48 TaxID=1975024 RepID=A0A2M8LCS0_9BACT|nr:MAG: hypothetical protein COV01_00040 [Candidatus Taylorbacteria bacterium CG10_big_fil_rev_8_21_14_0_10_41_48]
MPSNNLILFIVNRGKKVLLIKQAGRKALWTLPGGRSPPRDGFTHAAYQYLRPYFRDLTVIRVKYIRAPVKNIAFSDEYRRLILMGCDIRGTIKKKMRYHVWFTDLKNIMHHIAIPGTVEILSLPEVQNRLA